MKRLRRRYGRALGPRPADPSRISFDPRCFVQDDVEVHFTVGRSALYSGPKRFDREEDAAEYARRVGRPYTRIETPRMRRIRWTCPEA